VVPVAQRHPDRASTAAVEEADPGIPDTSANTSTKAGGIIWQAARNGNKRMQWGAMIYPGEGKKGQQPKAGDYVLAAEQTRAEAAADPQPTRGENR
jgi:hypothetical protein